MDLNNLSLEFVTDGDGVKKAVILPMEAFIELIEDLEDLALIAERRDEPTVPFEQVIADLKLDGILPD